MVLSTKKRVLDRRSSRSRDCSSVAAERSLNSSRRMASEIEVTRERMVEANEEGGYVLSREEVALLLSSVRCDRFRTILRLIYHTGLRIREACRIEVQHIDRAGGRIHVKEGKGGKDRYVPIAPAMLKDLGRFWRRHQHPKWLFPGLRCDWKLMKEPAHSRARQAKTPMSESSVQGAFRLALAQSGIGKPATPHTLRHSYATHLLEEGVSIRLIGEYLGHASLDATVVYTHLTACNEARTREALERLQAQTCGKRATGTPHR